MFDSIVDGRHLRNAAQQFGPQGVAQEPGHDAALMDAAGDALPLEFMDELVQPEMDGDWARAQRGAMGAVEHPFVGENGARGVVRGGGSESRSGLDFGMAERWLDRTEGLFGGSE